MTLDRRRVTDAQRRALEAIRDGKVSHSMLAAHARGYSPWTLPHGIRRDTVERVIGNGLAKLGGHKQPSFIAKAELTDAGREAIS